MLVSAATGDWQGGISDATRRNWHRLAVVDQAERLQKRANKTRSSRFIIPLEYLSSRRNLPVLQQLLSRIRQERMPLPDVLFSLGRNLLRQKQILERPHVQAALESCQRKSIPELESCPLPEDEFDFLGLLYQCLKPEGEKHRQGSYYTPLPLIKRVLREILCPAQGANWLDPCCGSGAFLLAMPAKQPQQLTGIDNDELAVMLAKINLLLKFPEREFSPQIYCRNFLLPVPPSLPEPLDRALRMRYDYIVSNPPWGNCGITTEIKSAKTPRREIFSLLLRRAYQHLRPGGELHFLLPEAALQIRAHREIRGFLLQDCRLHKISVYPPQFTGVSSGFASIFISRARPQKEFLFSRGGLDSTISRQTSLRDKDFRFQCISPEDREILCFLYARGQSTLAGSRWGMGIVTGDNRRKLRDHCPAGWEAIYTGREIAEYQLSPPRKFIRFMRSELQQAAADDIYRAPLKLVYKFISPRPVFACDFGQHLFLNSANILIPAIPGFDCLTVLAFLNSWLFQYIYRKQFSDLKVLKRNLLQLPFPDLKPEQNQEIKRLGENILAGQDECRELLEDKIFAAFALPQRERKYILEQREQN